MKFEDRKGYLKQPINPHNEPYVDGLNSMLESLHEHDDRSVVLNMAAFAEDTLELLLLAYLRETKHAKELVTGFNAPLGTFSARAKGAFVLGLVRKDGYEALDLLRRIRNKFAHNWKGVSLDRDDINSLINRLPLTHLERLTDSVGRPKVTDRELLIHRMTDVLIDLRMLAKSLTKSGSKAPLVMGDRKAVHVEFVLVDELLSIPAIVPHPD